MSRLEFESAAELKACLEICQDLSRAVFQSIDLTPFEESLRGVTLTHNVLLGCKTNESVLALFDAPILLPTLPELPFNPFRASLYSPEELLGDYQIGDADSYAQTLDGKIYDQFVDSGMADATDIYITLSRRLHDHGITDALHEYLPKRKVVAIMGGHSMLRSDPTYLEVARLSRELVQAGYLPATGGGPGAMEATHLGAWFAERHDDELIDAVRMLSDAPLYKPRGPWLDAAFRVAKKYPLTSRDNCQSLGIPTWLYGHEPPSCFAVHIAKYFANSVREEGLLAIAKHGVVFSPGSAGTIQEIFQDACQNHYKSFGHESPMIFLGQKYWTETKPVYPLLSQLADGQDYGRLIAITDSRLEVLRAIEKFTP